jgi:uncharacterized membrane protein
MENEKEQFEELKPIVFIKLKEIMLMIPWLVFVFASLSMMISAILVQLIIHVILEPNEPLTYLWVMVTLLISLAAGGIFGFFVKRKTERKVIAKLKEAGVTLTDKDKSSFAQFMKFAQSEE